MGCFGVVLGRVVFGGAVVGVGGDGGMDGVAPVIGAEGVDVFVLGDLDGIDQGLAEVGQGGGGLALDAALGYAAEDLAEGIGEIAGGEVAAGEAVQDIAADDYGGVGLRLLKGMRITKMRMVFEAGRAAFAAISKGEGTQGRAVLGADRRHGSLQK